MLDWLQQAITYSLLRVILPEILIVVLAIVGLRLVTLAAVAAKQWVFTLSAIGVIETAKLAPSASIGLFLVYVLAAQAFGLIAVIAVAVVPRSAGTAVAHARKWLERHNRPVLIAFSLIFGLFFLFKGITGLLG